MSGLRLAMLGGCEWIDSDNGSTQSAGFIGPPDGRLFAGVHLPRDEPASAVLVCSPVFVEAERNYRREVLLGRSLARRGLACFRFHYRGTGNSDRLDLVSLTSMAEDARRAADQLQGEGVPVRAIVATRVAAPVAVELASDRPGTPLVLWDPVVDVPGWIREVRRATRVAAISDPRDTDRPGDGREAIGYELDPAAFDRLATIHPPVTSPVLLVQMRRESVLIDQYQETVGRWRESGVDVTATVFPLMHSWWFLDHDWTAEEAARQEAGLIEPTAAWIRQQTLL
jgi:hypothetical protein